MVAGQSDPGQARGAYGSELVGLATNDLLVPLEGGRWPKVRIRVAQYAAPGQIMGLGRDGATIDFGPGERAVLDRQRGEAVFVTTGRSDDGSLIHPLLASAAAVFAWWRGQVVLHGGAFEIGGGAWGLLGVRGSGKSSLLARLALLGHDVMTDDVLVVSGQHALAGPRCVDLREEVVGPLGLSERTDLVRQGHRKRLRLGPVQPEVPLRGWISLGWGPKVRMRALAPGERLACLAANLVGLHHTRFLELGSLPAWELTRPPQWRSFEPAVERLLEVSGP